MNSAQPIRTPEELEHFKEYYQLVKPRPRNYLLIVLGLNTALRISDILELRWGNVYDFIQRHYRDHISITEQKTGKKSCIFLNQSIVDALEQYRRYLIFQKKKEIIYNAVIFYMAAFFCTKKGTDFRLSLKFLFITSYLQKRC